MNSLIPLQHMCYLFVLKQLLLSSFLVMVPFSCMKYLGYFIGMIGTSYTYVHFDKF